MDESNFKLRLFGVFAFCTVIFSYLQFTLKNIVEVDGLFHIKYASLILQEGIMRPFYWWQFASYADTHFLYHILLIPFTWFGLVTGAKLSVIFFGALCFTLIYWFMKKNDVEFPFFWVLTIFAFGSQAFYRYNMPRAITFAIIFFILAFYFILNEKYKFLGVLLFAFAWGYTGFIILLGLIVLYFIYKILVFGKTDFNLLKYSFGGALLGLVINPFFPENIKTIYVQVFKVLLVRTDLLLQSADALPFQSVTEIFAYFWFIMIIFILSLYLFFKRKEYNNKTISLIAIASVMSFILLFKGIRFVEYWVPFTVIFSSFIFSKNIHGVYDKTYEIIEGKSFKLDRTKVIAIMLIILLPFLYLGLSKAHSIMLNNDDLKKLDENLPCGRWLDRNTPKGSLVFNYWNEFPLVFFHDTNNKFIVGLDPNYMYNDNPELYKKYEKILLIQTNLTNKWLKEDFKADYIFLGTFTNKLTPYYDLFKDFEKVFSTDYCTVYKVKK